MFGADNAQPKTTLARYVLAEERCGLALWTLTETGVISKEMLARYLKDATSPIYYIAGPPAMVKGLHMMINESGVDEADIRTEEFSGY